MMLVFVCLWYIYLCIYKYLGRKYKIVSFDVLYIYIYIYVGEMCLGNFFPFMCYLHLFEVDAYGIMTGPWEIIYTLLHCGPTIHTCYVICDLQVKDC